MSDNKKRIGLAAIPYPDQCEKPCADEKPCARDAGHKGKCRSWGHPECDTCGAEMAHNKQAVSYSCSHPRVVENRAQRLDRAWQLAKVRRVVAYAMTGYPQSGLAPTREQYDRAQEIVMNLEAAGALLEWSEIADACRADESVVEMANAG